MEEMKPENLGTSEASKGPRKSWKILNGIIIVLVAVVAYIGYSYLSTSMKMVKVEKKSPEPLKIIQVDVLNGCGVKGVGSKFTDFLRRNNIDVVEFKNYKTFQVPHTLVLDRVGDISKARRVAQAIGVSEQNIIQEINPDYFVDVSVVIGMDYSSLNPSR